MKVIDLLNKIANGETKEEIMFQYNNGYEEYANINTLFDRFTINKENLNTEIEIIEEDKKIRKICTFPGLDDDDYAYEDGNRPNNVKINNKIEELLIDKINEIIDYLEENK